MQDLQQGYEVVKPSLTFSDRHTLDLGDLTLELIFFGKGHSTSDILIYVPQERVLVSGAIAYQQYRVPEIGEESHLEDVHRFIAVLDSLLADNVKIDHVIPGHSVPLTRAALPPIRDYYRRMLKEVEAARRQGLTLDQTTKLLTLRAKFPAFREPPAAHVWRGPPGAQREEPLAHPGRGPGRALVLRRFHKAGLSASNTGLGCHGQTRLTVSSRTMQSIKSTAKRVWLWHPITTLRWSEYYPESAKP